ncbi:MAG: transcriptional repressor [Acidobacteria bacterium]|nr:transcriptional repressor [Acidobacteriota bacterium]MBI3655030.1 transcriptional repressor [Acidobacteriota bacterium]
MLTKTKREKEVFFDYLKEHGLNRTAQKELVLDTFLKTEGHLSVEDTYQQAKQKDLSIGYVTVYRTLKSLVACGLAREVDLGDGRTRFEHFYNHPHHHHIICTTCKKTIEFLSTDLEQLQEEIIRYYGFEPLYHSFQIYGTCNDCQHKRTGSVRRTETVNDKVFLRDALRIVIDFENKGLDFYRAAAEHTKNASGRLMFSKIADEEKDHLAVLKIKYEKLLSRNKTLAQEPQFLHFNPAILDEIFPPGEAIPKLINEDTNELQALTIAIDSERDSYEFFQRYAERFKDSKGKRIFVSFTQAEKQHLTSLQREYERLTGQRSAKAP